MKSHFRIWFLPILLLFIIFSSCKKDKASHVLTGYKIVLKSGDGQTAPIGGLLPNDPVFKVSRNDSPSFNGYVYFETMDCDGEIDTVQYFVYPINPARQTENLLQRQWRLNATMGKQTMKAVLYDSLNIPRDSTFVTATGTAPVKGWNGTTCIHQSTFAMTFCELPSGRVLAGLYNSGYPYYSDDEGISWHRLKTTPPGDRIRKLISTSANEVFLGSPSVGVYFSSNGGQSWEARNNGLPSPSAFTNMYMTSSGKLFASTINGVFLSSDKGVNWHLVSNGIPFYASFWDANSLSDGTIIALSSGNVISSTDGGENWRPVYTISGAQASSVFCDNNDNVFVGVAGSLGLSDGLYKSDKTMQTWNKIYTVNPPPNFDRTLSAMTMKNGTYYFYSSSKNILTSSKNLTDYTTMDPPVVDNNGRKSFTYIVTKNDHIIVSTEFFGMFYYAP